VLLFAALGRIKQLVFGQGQSAAVTQYWGAISQLRETLQIFHGQSGKLCQRKHTQMLQYFQEGSFVTSTDGTLPSIFYVLCSLSTIPLICMSTGVTRKLGSTHRDVSKVFLQLQRLVDNFGSKSGTISQALSDFEEEIMMTNVRQAAFSILLQRPSITGAERFKLNDLEEKPEQEEGTAQQIVRVVLLESLIFTFISFEKINSTWWPELVQYVSLFMFVDIVRSCS
jgi:hypothetical protein